MKQEMAAENNPLSYPALAELTVIKERVQETETSFYDQIRRALPGAISPQRFTTPFLHFPLDKPANRWMKRSVDFTISAMVILGLLSWFIPLMAIIIKLDSRGPVFFFQKRNKRNGGVFTCIKFRSMIVNPVADVLPAGRYDHRITRVGKFIRRHYIDELPQFINVLLGDMSIIGPRPHMLSDNLKYGESIEHYQLRSKVKPGITGLAQVLGYVGATDNPRLMTDRIRMDNFYLRHWTPRLDLAILVRTLFKPFGI